MTEVGLIALVMTFVIVTGGIDLSVGSILGMTAILLGVFWKNIGLPLPVAIGPRRSSSATFAGFVNGVIITRFRVPPLIATLGTLALYRGIAEGISQARSVRGYPDWFFVLGQGEVLGVPTQLWLFGLVARRSPRSCSAYTTFGPHHLRHRLQRGRGALLRPRRRPRPRSPSTRPPASSPALAAVDLRLARLDHALRHGHRHRARRHHRRRARRHLDLRRARHHHRHPARASS